jgi:hypothetical protein
MEHDSKSRIQTVYEETTIKSVVGSLKEGTVWTAKKVWDFSPRTVWEGISTTAVKAKNAVTPIRKPKSQNTIDLSGITNMTAEDLMEFVQSQLNTSILVVSKNTGEVIDTVEDAQFVVKSMDTVEEETPEKESSSTK